MTTTLVYVDSKLVTAMGVKLVGLELVESETVGVEGGFNWLIQAYITHDEGVGITRDIRELLPEDVMYAVYDSISDEYKLDSVSACIEKLAETGEGRLLPGHPITVKGNLKITGLADLGDYNPFDPPDIELKSFQFYGEECFTGEIHGNGFKLPVYFDVGAKAQVVFCHDNPVEVVGIVRWTPAYNPRGARSLNLIIRAAGVWLR